MAGRFWDPEGSRYGRPTWPVGSAPDRFATKDQLRARGLCPGGQPVVGQVLWYSRLITGKGGSRASGEVRSAALYLVALAKPAPAKSRARGDRPRRRGCPACGHRHDRVKLTPRQLQSGCLGLVA